MKKITLAKVGDVSIVDRTYAPAHWEDGEPNNAWSMADSMEELLALAGKAYANAVKDGSIRKFLTDGFPIQSELPPHAVNVNLDPDDANLFQLTDRGRRKRTAEMFGASHLNTQVMARKTSDGVSVSFAFDPGDYGSRFMGYEYGSLTYMQGVLDYIPKDKSVFPRSTWEGMTPEGLENLRAINAWIKRRFPIGKPVTFRIPLENLLPDEFTETDDGEPSYNLAYLRESSSFLTVSVINTSDNKTTTSLSWSYATPEQREKYAKLFDNGYATITQTDEEILQEGSPQVVNLTLKRVNDLRISFGIEIDLNTEEFDYVTQGTNDLSDVGEYVNALVKNVSNGDDYAYFFASPDLNNSAPSRVGVGQTMISPYNLLPMYIPTTNQWEQYRAQRTTAYITPDGEYIRDRKDFPYDPKQELYGQNNVLPYGVMGVDWTTNMMFYDEGKGLKTLDLSDFATTKPLHVARFARSQDIYSTSNSWGTAINRIYRYMTNNEKFLSEKSRGLLQSVLNYARGYKQNLELVWGFYTDDIGYKLVPNPDLEVYQAIREGEQKANDYNNLESISSDSPLPFGQLVASILTDFLNLWLKNPTLLIKDGNYTVPNLLHMVGVASVWYESYEDGAKRKAFNTLANASVNKRQPDEFSQLPDGFKPDAIPNIKDGVFMLPHQAKVAYSMQQNKEHTLLEVAAGGGKTLSIIMDILRKLKDGVIKNPVVYCPAHLLANYVQDANYATEGKLNVIPLNTETYNRLGPEYYEKVAKGKPKNTFFVIAYNFASLKSEVITAGTSVVPYYPNAQWLRSLQFDIAYLDESHYLKNDSSRTHAMREALIDVPRITLATGTFYPTRVSDIINQTFLWDSGLFGYPQTFENQYPTENGIFTETSRNYVNSVLTEAVCVSRAKRKEWAAVLPDRTVAFHSVPLSKEARTVYEAILKQTLDEIKKDPVIMKLLAKADESDEEADIGDALQRYLQRLEKAITCPYQDELWQAEWGQQSPKLKVVEKICRDHIKKGIKGKILIFCSYHSSVDAIYDNLPPDLKDLTIRYSAGKDSPKFRQQFEKDDSKLIMIGVENSMNTGINAQFASRLIRIDSIYSPGQLEQGESRVCRPNLKVKEFREHLYFDWVLAEKTYDATKTARLVSKILDVEKFNNMHDPKYKQLKDLPVLRLNFDVIEQSSDFEGELQDYLTEYLRLENGIKVADVQDYRRRNPDLSPIPVESAGLLKGSALMKHVPYIPLGGVPSILDGDFKPLSGELQNHDPKELKGAFVHTEYGEGVLTRVGTGTSTVEIPGQGKISLNNQTIYMIDKRTTSTKSIQQELAQKLKLKRVDVVDTLLDSTETVNEPSLVREEEVQETEVEEAPIKEVKVKSTKREPSPVPQDDEEDMMVNLYPSFVNEFYALSADEFTDWEEATGNDLAEYGFKPAGPIMYLQLKRWKQAADLKELWKESGILAPKSFYATLDFLADAMKTNKTRMVTYQHLQRSVKDLLSWNLSKKRKQPSDRIRPYFCIQDGAVYVIIDRNSSPAYAKIKGKVRVPGAKWHMEDGARWYISTKRTDLVKTIKQMIKDGVPIADLDWVKQTVSHMKTAVRKE